MDSVKNRGRSKFSACFNPSITREDDPCFQPPPQSLSSDDSRRRKTIARRSLFYFVKAIFFKTPLLNKLRNKRSKRDSHKSSNAISSKLKKLTKKKKRFSDEEEENSDSYSSLFSSTSFSRASSASSISSSGSERIKASSDSQDLNRTKNIGRNAVKLLVSSSKCDCRGLMFIILVCLVALVFWGKFFAIVTCTSGWLFWAPGRAPHGGGPPPDKNVVGSDGYKKRVIMEGLLERNIRSRMVVQ